jgi:predicted GNAT family N-acyltransferase
MIETIRFLSDNQELLSAAHKIRTQVFVKEQGVPISLECDKYDLTASHYLVNDNNKPVATARWRETKNGIKLERFAILKQYRNKNIGFAILKEVLLDVTIIGKTVYLHAQLPVVGFYEKYGFVKEGEEFKEAGISHYKMIYSGNPL